jgi:hypothetical protein
MVFPVGVRIKGEVPPAIIFGIPEHQAATGTETQGRYQMFGFKPQSGAGPTGGATFGLKGQDLF